MDAKITLSFDAAIIERAKKYAEAHNMSLSRMMELVLDKITTKQYDSIEEFPISDWVNIIAEGPAEYKVASKKRRSLKDEYHTRKK
jgi:hypothetical protein